VSLREPLRFRPVYKTVVWGGRRLLAWRPDVPDGPVGESWDLADHPDGMTVVAEGPLAGQTLAQVLAGDPAGLVGAGFAGQTFPLMVKLIDASQRLSVQVHPDDDGARALGLGDNGKTECWRVVADGGVIFQGTRPGIDRAGFEAALAAGRLEEMLNRFEPQAGDFFFLQAGTVHALGEGCLVYEIQQTSNITFRVYDWGRMGLDGKPRPLHVAESLETIDFQLTGFGPRHPPVVTDPRGGRTRLLADCPHFRLEERVGTALQTPSSGCCAVVVCLEGRGRLDTGAGGLALEPMQTLLVPAAAGDFTVQAAEPIRVLVAEPRL
jgi:mannose-6-phosphate isomerase